MSSIARRLAVVAAAALTVAAVAGAAPTSYLDPSGDNGGAADIGAVTAELASDGYLHIKATIANMPALSTPGSIVLALDTDRSASTGFLVGGDYVVLLDTADLSGVFLKWNGSDYEEATVQTGDVRFLVGGGSVEFQLRPAVVGGVTSFNFILGAATGSGEAMQFDLAPDTGSWFYEKKAPVAVSAKATYASAAPRAGKPFKVTGASVQLDDGSATTAESFRCRATLAGKALRGTGSGGCTYAMPKTAKGKRLAVTVSATYAGRTLTAARTFVVR